jgi:hypothetical protein
VVTQALLSVLLHVWTFCLGLLPTFGSLDDVTGGLSSAIGTLAGYAAGSGAWVPWGAIAVSLLLVSTTLAASLGLKIGLKVLLVFTGGGGGG